MAKRTGAVALVAGALFALGAPASAAGRELPEGARAEWTLTAPGVSLGVTAPAVRTADGGASLPALDGDTDSGTGVTELELGGAARLDTAARQPLVLAGLRLRLTGVEGELYARTVVDGRARELALAEVAGSRASLTEEGAALLSSWSGTEFTAGEGLGEFEVTLPEAAVESPQASPPPVDGAAGQTAEPTAGPTTDAREAAAAAVARSALAPGTEQTVSATGFAPGAVVLVAIDGDTRYQDVADAQGRLARSFPVYATAVEGAHIVELTQVGGEQQVVAVDFTVH
ncbi:hypothetical protein [Streptomyces sp. NPDC000618]|uniref:hypothetical protein n=1 Tax=Streptomyces sp. NPDC000618 TaxID=3154265 RepID=UPI00332B91F0